MIQAYHLPLNERAPQVIRLLFLVFCLAFTQAHAQQIPAGGSSLAFLRTVDCFGHKGLTTVCFKNASSSTIVSAKCGDYDVPLLTRYKTIPPGSVAAVIDLGNSVRTCRRSGIDAYTEDGVILHGQLNAATVDDATEVWFRDPQGK